jgi:fructose-1,6-bisphosphatase/inositol monophosphatase family enzyme
MNSAQLERIRRLLCVLQSHIRDSLVAARLHHAKLFSRIEAVTAADTIYHVDRISEDAIFMWFEKHWPRGWPVELVMEGMAEGTVLTFPRETPVAKTLFKCILDPVDGTRGLMYNKRAAWILAGLAPQRGARTHLGDIVVAAMTELPTTKQWRADQFSAVRGRHKVIATAIDLRRGARAKFSASPSRARDFRHGFSSFARFFPAGKALTAQIEETLWLELHGRDAGSTPLVFDDQYISTGGQLLVGHDRMIGDLRPLVFAKLRVGPALTCHPYDICTELILREAGGIVETPDGKPLRAPLDTVTPVAWIGYANPTLARIVRPILRRLLHRFL